MTKKEIRIHYSGLIIFASQILSVATGLVFTLLLTRNMSTSQFGIWTNIFDYTGYFMLFSSVLPFWATRFMARNKEGTVKTSFIAQLTVAVACTLVYLPVIVLISNALGTQAYILSYLLAGLYIFDFYLVTIAEGVLRSVRPQVIGYGLLIEEVVKVVIALIVIVGLKQLFLGAMLALAVSALVQVFYYVKLLWGEFKQKVEWGYLKEWFKGSTVIAYNAIGGQIYSFIMVLLFYYGYSNTRAYYQAAFTFTNVIGYAASLAFAVYPRLLAKSCNEDQIGASFRSVMMFAIPLSAITMVMASSFLTILDVQYAIAWPVVIALTISTLIGMISTFYTNCLMGVETFDAEGKISLRKLLRSKIFKVFTLPYIHAALALPLVYYVLTTFPVAGSVDAAVYVIAIGIVTNFVALIGMYWVMRSSTRLPIAWRSISKYVLVSIVMGVALFYLPYTTTLSLTVTKAIVGLSIYVGLLLIVDKQARTMLKTIIQEIRTVFGTLRSKNSEPQLENGFLDSEN